MSDADLKNIQINMAKLETNLDNLTNKLEEHNIDQKKDIKDIKDTINNFIKEADKKYAPMWVAEGFKWGIKIVITAVILTILSIIGIKSHFL